MRIDPSRWRSSPSSSPTRGSRCGVARGTYAIGVVPRSTAYRIRRQAIAIQLGRAPGVDEVTTAARTALADLIARRSA